MTKSRWLDNLVFFLATRFGWLFILLWGKLTRIEFIGREHLQWVRSRGKPFILSVWHGRVLLPIYVHRHENIQAMVSEHRDGEMIARTLIRLGYGTVRGSSTRGGRKAAIGMIRALRQGAVGAVIPDGPTGPRCKLKPGLVTLAQRSGAYILPITFASSRRIVFKSWDRFYLWLPFARSVVVYGKPIAVSPDLAEPEFAASRKQIENEMCSLESMADAHFRK